MVTFLQKYRPRVMLGLAIVAPLVVAAILVPFRGTFANAAAGMTLVVVIVAVAVGGNRFSGFLASVSSALWFDFFLTRPYDRFAISQRGNVETAVALLVVGLLVSELAARSRHFSRVSTEETTYVAMVRDLTEYANSAAASSLVIEWAIESLSELLNLRACHFDLHPSDPPMAQIQPDGDVVHVGMLWPTEEMGIPGPEAEIVCEWRGRTLGRFVITPTPGRPIAREPRVVAALLASVVGASLASDSRVP
ncbi:MAG: Osmosensitive channel histidine kinaselike protein [Acidimicrobiaceae bacterium]|nr:Osmosensitive channel histidine kinaselike protein [Acidimicrobiaceae bacterium]